MRIPLLSIVMPSFQQAAYLEEAICSVLDQNYPKKELIVMDGGSDDGSLRIIERYQARLAFWTSAPDGGQSEALDQGFLRAKGDLCCWVCSDDILFPGALSAVADAWELHGQCDWVAGNCCWLDVEGRVTRCLRGMGWSGPLARLGHPGVAAPSSFFSPRLYREVGGLDRELHYTMDSELWLRFARQGARFVRVPRYLWGFRRHPEAKTSGHHYAGTIRARPDHEGWAQRRREYQRIADRYALGARERRMGSVLSRTLRTVSGASALALRDTMRWRGRHWTDCGCAR